MPIDFRGMDTTETTELMDRFGGMACELEKHLVSHHPSAWHVPPSGFRFSPGRQFTQYRSPFGLERVPSANTLVALLGLSTLFADRRLESGKFLTDPLQPAKAAQAIL